MQQRVNSAPPDGEPGRSVPENASTSRLRHSSFTPRKATGKSECRAAA
jgi:hypothetical protein